MAVDLVGGHPNKSRGEVFADLRYHPPLCLASGCVTAPVNLEGITVTAKVFGPAGSRGDPQLPNGFQLLVKDQNWRSFYGSWQNITATTWMTVAATPGRTAPPLGHMDSGFDPTKIVLVGLKIGAGSGSSATFSGTIWLDEVDWPGGQRPKYPFDHITNPLDQLKTTNINYVALIDTWYMDTLSSTVIYSDAAKTHTDSEIASTIRAFHSRGIKVLLKPHIDVQDGAWRGNIVPSDAEAWCDSYTDFITHFAQIAQEEHVELFSVGTELESMSGSQYRPCWNTIIGAVQGIYTGTLTYAANWDGYKAVSFWDKVDIVGIDAYFPLSNAREPSVAELIAGWQPWIDQIADWQANIGKPVVFTEIGYRNVEYCAKAPWSFAGGQPASSACQARAYKAALKALAGKPWFRGMFWWQWSPWSDAGGYGETSFTPQNKPAQQLLTCFDTCFVYLPFIARPRLTPAPSPTPSPRPTPMPTPTSTPIPPIDCGTFPDSPNGRYTAKVIAENGTHYEVRDNQTGEVVLITSPQYASPNDVKAGGFSADSEKFAAAYHYSHAGSYTWIGIWSLETGEPIGSKTKSGWTTDLCGVFD